LVLRPRGSYSTGAFYVSFFIFDTLELHPNKVFIKTLASGVDFLGWVHFPDHRVLRTTTKKRLLKALKNDPSRAAVQSYKGMMSHGHTQKLRRELGFL
jgi:hypothetical protein